MGRKSNIYKNKKLAKIYYFMLQKEKVTPSEIAKSFGISQPTVIDHLNKLLRGDLVIKSKKIKQRQYYKANWNVFITVFIEFMEKDSSIKYEILAKEIVDKKKTYVPDKYLNVQVKKFFNQLTKNKYFRKLLINYFKEIATFSPPEKEPSISIMESIRRFEIVLFNSKPYLKNMLKKSKKEKKKFLNLLLEWCNGIESFYFEYNLLIDSLKKLK